MTGRTLLFLTIGSMLLGPVAFGAGVPMNLINPQAWALQSPGGYATVQSETGSSIPGGNAQKVTVSEPSNPYYEIGIAQTLNPAVPADDRMQMTFLARSATNNPLRAAIEEAGAPYDIVAQDTVTLTPQWQTYQIEGAVTKPYGPSGIAARLQMGQQVGSVEIADVSVTDLGPDVAYTQALAAIQPAAEQARIQKYRMADLTVRVVGLHGQPSANVQVHVQMVRSAFLFGCNMLPLNLTDHSADQQAYQSRFAALFNFGTLPFFWGAVQPQQTRPDFTTLDADTEWAIAHGITLMGHPLVWHEVWPSWAPTTADASIPLLQQYVTDSITHFKNTIHDWVVINEANSADPKTGEGAWIKRDGAASVVGTVLGWARNAGHGAPETFLYNDYNTGDANIALLSGLQKRGELPDAIGIQSHMQSGVWPLSKVWMVCQSFSQFGKPIYFTETTVLSGDTKPNFDYTKTFLGTYVDWPTTPAGEAAQADYVPKFYTLLFSNPSLRGITWWDLSDKNAWLGAPSGLLRADMSPKPAYNDLMTLIHKTWWTDVHGTTNIQGRYIAHAFYGDYQITVKESHGHSITQTIDWPEDAGPRTVTMKLP